jgi:hypothetical protein
MYSTENYLWGWVAYTSGVICLLWVAWYLLRNIRFSTLRQLLLLVSAIFFLTPVTAYTDNAYLAPAFFVSLYEGLMSNGDPGFQRGAAPILAFTMFGLIGYDSVRLILWRFKKPPKKITNND